LQTAIEAIEKMVQQKKFSTKINYDALRSLSMPSTSKDGGHDNAEENQVRLPKRNQSQLPEPSFYSMSSPLGMELGTRG
jgi:hypothetical protein